MKLKHIPNGTVFYFAENRLTAFRKTQTGITNLVTGFRTLFERFPSIANMEVEPA